MSKKIFIWDNYSDQPYVIKNRAYKKQKRKKYILEYLLSYLGFFITLPFFVFVSAFLKGAKTQNTKIGIGVNLDKETKQGANQPALINELGVKELLIRVPLSDIKNIKDYVKFAKSFGEDKTITINILQDREHIKSKNRAKLKKSLSIIFKNFDGICNEFQIANAINRIKWGFFAISEYLAFYKVVQNLRDKKYPHFKLIAPNIIDFEYQYLFSSLYNNKKVKFDILNNLLYVDRRGSPYNRQLGFSFKNKISLLYCMNKFSPKTTNIDAKSGIKSKSKIYITETNWPIKNTAPYAPTGEKECVSLETYSKYMIEYFDIAKNSGKIDKVFWHQLLAKGYGLGFVDEANGDMVKYPAFFEFKKYIKNNKENI